MRTALFIVGGIVLFCVCALGARFGGLAAPTALAAKVFVPVWLVVGLVNLRGGVRAGYTVAEELPIFFVIFAVPVAVALLAWWKLP